MSSAAGGDRVLSGRALNRALLERQHLLARQPVSALKEIEHLVALQSQVPNSPYVGLWTRLDRFQPEKLADLITSRRAVRIAMQRSTVHLVSAADCLRLRPLFGDLLERSFHSSASGRQLLGMDFSVLVAEATRLVEATPRTLVALGKLLHERWPDRDSTSLAYAVRNLVPLVQVPPRGLWGKSGTAACTTVRRWLGHPLDPKPSLERLIRRYLRAFGPATVADFQSWSGLKGSRPSFERLRRELRTFADERGRELFDVLDGPLPDPEIPAPVRFLPEFDNLVLGHEDRTRVIDFDYRYIVGNPMILVDGFIAGNWSIERRSRSSSLKIQTFGRLRPADRRALTEEGLQLLGFAAPDAPDHEIRFERVAPRSNWQR